MIKKIVFDMDNTLMDWKDEYIFALKNVINKLNLNYSFEKIKEIDSALTDYENYYDDIVASKNILYITLDFEFEYNNQLFIDVYSVQYVIILVPENVDITNINIY